MLREQMINFLEAAVVFLLVLNAFSILTTICAIQLLSGARGRQFVPAAINRKLETLLNRNVHSAS